MTEYQCEGKLRLRNSKLYVCFIPSPNSFFTLQSEWCFKIDYKHKKKKEILPFAATWTDLEGIMLSEISQRKTNTVCITYM